MPCEVVAALIACTPLFAFAACSAVDEDLLGPIASSCELGARGVIDDITPPGIIARGGGMGVREVVLDPFDRAVLYVSTNQQGVYRSADCGATWTHMNTGINAPMIENAQPFGFALDPFVPDTLYVGARFGGQSIWTSDNAGVHWTNILPDEVAIPLLGATADINRIATVPDAAHHVIMTAVGGWQGYNGDSGVLEGVLAGDAWNWTVHPPAAGMGTQQELAVLDVRTWMVVNNPTGGGAWITRDAGATFVQLDDHVSAGDGFQLYRAADGTIYRPSTDGLLRSTDGGATWIDVYAGLGLGGTRSVIGTGTTLYASSNIPAGDSVVRLFTAPEVPGDRGWMRTTEASSYNLTRFLRDELRGVLYTLREDGSVWRMAETP